MTTLTRSNMAALIEQAYSARNEMANKIKTEIDNFERGLLSAEATASATLRSCSALTGLLLNRLGRINAGIIGLHRSAECSLGFCIACWITSQVHVLKTGLDDMVRMSENHRRALEMFGVFSPMFPWRYRLFLEGAHTLVSSMKFLLHGLRSNHVRELRSAIPNEHFTSPSAPRSPKLASPPPPSRSPNPRPRLRRARKQPNPVKYDKCKSATRTSPWT